MKTKHIILYIGLILTLSSCFDEFLSEKPQKSLLVPESLNDFSELINNLSVMTSDPWDNHLIGDDYYYIEAAFNVLPTAIERNSYTFQRDNFFEGESSVGWDRAYEKIYYANVVLNGLNDVARTSENQAQWDQVRGTALFFRASSHLNIIRLFTPVYEEGTEQLGIPLKFDPLITATPQRSSLEDSYNAVIDDLEAALPLLPEQTFDLLAPGKIHVYGMLARVYLLQRKYDLAGQYADSVLSIKDDLIDFNELNVTAARPFPIQNAESFLYGAGASYRNRTIGYIDMDFYNSYDDNDLRKVTFFNNRAGVVTYKATYSGTVAIYTGLATDEFYLIKAESLARAGNVEDAIGLMNRMLVTRYVTGTYEPVSFTDPEEALRFILEERRKQLVFRGWRGDDLKRLNMEPRFATTITRTLGDQTFTLPPNDPRYVFPIPDQEVAQGIEQNPR